jgi:nicotinamidase/pyrazinamidase
MQALLLIDLQNDFLGGGALAVLDGDSVIEVANRAMDQADNVVATQDWHPPDHGSFASEQGVEVGQIVQLDGLPQIAWPDHCVQRTPGADLAANLNSEKIGRISKKGTNRMIDSYSGFFDNGHRQATGLDEYLRSVGIAGLSVMGLATDYCVKFTVLDALKLGYPTRVLLEGCRGVDLNEGDVAAAIAEMQQAGAVIVPRGIGKSA